MRRFASVQDYGFPFGISALGAGNGGEAKQRDTSEVIGAASWGFERFSSGNVRWSLGYQCGRNSQQEKNQAGNLGDQAKNAPVGKAENRGRV